MTQNICLSGGAVGADVAWGLIAKDQGHEVIHYSFAGHRGGTNDYLHELTLDELAAANPQLKIACKAMNKHLAKKEWILKLLQRNYYQVVDSERVYAISEIDPTSLGRTGVKGGTAYAVEMAIDLGVKEIHVFDQLKGQWFTWSCGHWLLGTPDKPHGRWTGIGSRKLTDQGLQAIIDLFKD